MATPRSFQQASRGISDPRRSAGRNADDGVMISASEVDKWRLLLDPEATGIASFLSLFEIPTEGEKDFAWFQLYEFQHGLVASMEAQWEYGKRAEFRIPKSRRRGVSMFFRAVFFERMLRVPGWRGCIIAQDDTHAKMHLQSLHELVSQLPEDLLRKLKIVKVRGSANEIAFKHGRFKTSSVIVKTASARGLGRGGQLNGVLQTERPHWAPQAKRDRSAFLGSCRNRPGNIVVDESTAFGFDEFYEDCMKSERGEGGHELVFLPSHHHDLNRLPFRRKPERDKVLATMGKVKRYGSDDERQAYLRVLRWRLSECAWEQEDAERDALEFIHWRRFKIDDDCEHFTVFHREEPTTLQEAFSGAGRRVLPVDVMESWQEAAEQRGRDGTVGTLVEKDAKGGGREVRFMPSRDGFLTVFEKPTKNDIYCFGSDTASGFETHSGGSAEADFSVMNVKEVFSGRTVAQLRGHIFAKPFGRALLQACVYYGGSFGVARGYVETNLETVVALLLEDDDLEVCGYVGEDVLLTSERKVRTRGVGTEVMPVAGFRTTEKSKEYLVARYERWMAEVGEYEPGSGKVSPVDPQTLREMLRYVRVPTAGAKAKGLSTRTRMQAEAGHDDCVMADFLAILARDELLTSGEVELSSKVRPKELDPVSEYMLRKEREEWGEPEPEYVPNPMGGEPIEIGRKQDAGGAEMFGF